MALLEHRIAAAVADRLGVDVDELQPDVSLVDDLAADSLDLIEIALAVEAELGRPLPRTFVDSVRTFGDLLHHARAVSRPPPLVASTRGVPAVRLHARLRRPNARSAGSFERILWLTPYGAETLLDDLRNADAGAALEVEVPLHTTETVLTWLRMQLRRVIERGVDVRIRRG
jgi:acyl carrier protein